MLGMRTLASENAHRGPGQPLPSRPSRVSSSLRVSSDLGNRVRRLAAAGHACDVDFDGAAVGTWGGRKNVTGRPKYLGVPFTSCIGRIQEGKRKMHNTSTYVGLRHPKGPSEPYRIISSNLIHVMTVSTPLARLETLSQSSWTLQSKWKPGLLTPHSFRALGLALNQGSRYLSGLWS